MSGPPSEAKSIEERLPAFVIFGAGKSGTTWLHNALRQHERVFMPKGETPFFEDPYYNEADLSALEQEYAEAPVGKLIGIKRPNYLGREECAPRIAKHLPDVKLLALLRHPVDRAVSAYLHLVRSGRFEMENPDEMISALIEGGRGQRYEDYILGFGRYFSNLETYHRYFSKDQIHLITDIELESDPKAVYRGACEFLDISSENAPWDILVPRNQGSYSPTFLKTINTLNRSRVSFDEETGAPQRKDGVFGRLTRPVISAVSKLSGVTRLMAPKAKQIVSDETRRKLGAYYLPEIEQLEAATGMDLARWKIAVT